MCDKKNNVLFTETECLVLSPDFKLLDESQVLLKVLRHDSMYNFDLKNAVPLGGNQTNRNAEFRGSVAVCASKKSNEKPANEGERNGQGKEGGASFKEGDRNVQDFRAELDNFLVQQKEGYTTSTYRVSTASLSVSTVGDMMMKRGCRGLTLNNTWNNHELKQKDDGIFISQDKYVADILKKFYFATVKTTSTPIETNKALLKDEEAKDVDVHLYRSMIGSLMYLTTSRPDIMFAVCVCVRFQVTPKVLHLHAVKRIFRYLKGQPKLGLWYSRDSPFDLEAFSDSDYARASLDRKSTIGGVVDLKSNA
ncbi:hypothetical protein Tco_0739248 [Tanacetum coccineum]